MSQTTELNGRRQGPKRSETSRQAILSAAREEIIEHGWRGFSADRLAKRAHASKQTVYRWWPSIAAIVVDAMLDVLPDPEKSDPSAGLQSRIENLSAPFSILARQGNGAHLLRGAVIAAADDAAASELLRAWLTTHVRKPLRDVLAEAANKKQIRRDWDLDIVVSELIGPTWHRLLALRGPLPESHNRVSVEHLIETLALK